MTGALCPNDPENHPARLILDQIADKWSILIVGTLCPGPLRFNQLRRELDGITQKTLTQTLRRLERLGLIERHVYPGSPVAVEYRITALGESLKEPFQALLQWSLQHSAEIDAAQARFESDSASAMRAV